MLSLIFFEMKKLIKGKAFLGALLTALLMLSGTYYIYFYQSRMSHNYLSNIPKQELIHMEQERARKHSGDLSDDLVQSIITDYVKSAPKDEEMHFNNVFEWEVFNDFVENSHRKLEEIRVAAKKGETVSLDEFQMKSVDELDTVVPKNELKLGQFLTWDSLYAVLNTVFAITIIFSVFVV